MLMVKMMKLWTGGGVKLVRTQMVSLLSAVGNVVRLREKRMKKARRERGVKLATTIRVRRSRVGNVVGVREKRMKKARRERGVKFVTTKRVRRSRAVGNAVVGQRERRMTRMKIAGTERGVRFVTTKWEKRRRVEGNASLPAIMKIMPTVIGNVAMSAMLVMTMRILLNVRSVLDRGFRL